MDGTQPGTGEGGEETVDPPPQCQNNPIDKEIYYDFAKAGSNCAKDLGKVKKGVQCIVDAVTIGIGISISANELIEKLLSDNPTTISQARACSHAASIGIE